ASMNTVMGPASGVRGISGLVAAKALHAALEVDPDREPGAAGALIQNDRVANGIREGALTVGASNAGKRVAAVEGDRCARNVDRVGVATSRVVVGDHDLLEVIWISCNECLRLGNMGIGLRASDQVDIGGTIREG